MIKMEGKAVKSPPTPEAAKYILNPNFLTKDLKLC